MLFRPQQKTTLFQNFAAAFAAVHEFPSPNTFFTELSRSLKPGGTVLLAEAKGDVKEFDAELEARAKSGWSWLSRKAGDDVVVAPAAIPAVKRDHVGGCKDGDIFEW